jgi:hypothetical protein
LYAYYKRNPTSSVQLQSVKATQAAALLLHIAPQPTTHRDHGPPPQPPVHLPEGALAQQLQLLDAADVLQRRVGVHSKLAAHRLDAVCAHKAAGQCIEVSSSKINKSPQLCDHKAVVLVFTAS